MRLPLFHMPVQVNSIMLKVLFALLPAIFAYNLYFGPAIFIQLALASLTAILAEAVMLRLRQQPVAPFLADGSAIVTAWLLALALPVTAPWWLTVLATLFAIVVAKHLYGGLGNNLFNPAMVGYAVMLISFPAYMTQWLAPDSLHAAPSLTESFRLIFGLTPPMDGLTMATPLDTAKTQLKLDLTVGELSSQPIFGWIGGKGSEMIALWYLAGGLILWRLRIISWHIPTAMLGALFVSSGLFWLFDPDRYVDPLFHLLTGGAMLGAFFIATDPVTGATTPKGKLIFGAGIGILVFLIRTFGGYPDGVAFAVLLMNLCVPLIDAYTQPPIFGHKKQPQQEGDR